MIDAAPKRWFWGGFFVYGLFERLLFYRISSFPHHLSSKTRRLSFLYCPPTKCTQICGYIGQFATAKGKLFSYMRFMYTQAALKGIYFRQLVFHVKNLTLHLQ